MDNGDHSMDQHFRRLRDLNQELTCHIQSRVLRREFRRAGCRVDPRRAVRGPSPAGAGRGRADRSMLGVSFCTRRRHSSRAVLASLTRWNGSAT